MVTHRQKVQHLFLRAGFGETPDRIDVLVQKAIPELVQELFANSLTYKDINYLPYPLNEREQKKGAGVFKSIGIFFKSFSEKDNLNEQWIFKMTYTRAVLREKMVFFWHNHFATSVENGWLMQQQNNVLRKHALGKFGDLIHAVSKDPAMIKYLNNEQNKKDHPNENFAREVMELFTLGIGHYTEKDIKEAARCFTGWSVDNTGEFVFHPHQHDDGEKEFLGRKGNFGGEDVINILLEEKQTAVYLCSKIYREFVNYTINEEHVRQMAETFYSSGYDIEQLMRGVFTVSWFYDDINIGAKIASPVELIVRLKKYLSVEFKENKHLVNYQKALGQVLFSPPNVAGWKGGAHWIDSASLLLRLNSIGYIHEEGLSLDINGKPAFEDELMDNRQADKSKKLTAKWEPLLTYCETKTDDELIEAFIQCDTATIDKTLLAGLGTRQKIIQLFTYPEFQLI
jgi:uncharacterized protein (DUF1800 family)